MLSAFEVVLLIDLALVDMAVRSLLAMVVAKSHPGMNSKSTSLRERPLVSIILLTVLVDPAVTADRNAQNTRAVAKSTVAVTAISNTAASVPNNRTARRVSPVALAKKHRLTDSLRGVVLTIKMNMMRDAGRSMVPVAMVVGTARRGMDVGIRVPC